MLHTSGPSFKARNAEACTANDLALTQALGRDASLVFAVGQMHARAHTPACFEKNSARSLPLTGLCNGEAAEILWANISKHISTLRYKGSFDFMASCVFFFCARL